MSEATVVTKEVEQGLAVLQTRSQAIAVRDAETCREAKIMQRDIRNYMKDVHCKLDPFVNSAKKNLQDAKDELARWIDPAEAIDSAVAGKVKEFERIEREFAMAEQRRINEENRIKAAQQAEEERQERNRLADIERKQREVEAKRQQEARQKEIDAARKAGEMSKKAAEMAARMAAEERALAQKEAAEAQAREKERAARDAIMAAANVQEVTVEPGIPSVAGVPSRRNYKARVIDASKVPDQFWIIDEQALGAEARSAKKVGEIIPGVLFYED
jgi:chromosome segregation ATPase